MPLPLAPLVPLAIRLGAVAAVGWAMKRAMTRNVQVGRTDQRAEDALDDLGEGVAMHHPVDRVDNGTSQTNATARLRRTLRWGDKGIEIDAGVMARFRLRKF